MRKGIKILGKVFSAAVLLLIIVPVALSLLLDIPAVQNYAVHRAACFVSRKLETTVSIDRVDIGIFSKVRVKGFYVEDYQRDTLLYVGKLDAFITSFGIFGGGLELSRGEIADARLYLRQTPGGEMNIKQIVDRISDPDKPKKGNFRLSLKKASIENMDLCLERLDHRDPEHGIDFSHMHLYGITARVDDFTIDGQAIYTSIVAFSARERSGFVLNHLAGRFYMTQGCLGFENASIITPRSNVNFPFVSLAGDSWAQYKDFIGEVRIDASMRNTTVSTDDIAFFAPKLRDWHVDFTDVNVEVAGVTSHGASPWLGINAVNKATKLIDAVEAYYAEHYQVDEKLGKSSIALTVINCTPGTMCIVPDRCNITYDRRLVPTETPEDAIAEIQAIIDRLSAEDPDFHATVKVSAVPRTTYTGITETKPNIKEGWRIAEDHPFVAAASNGLRSIGEPVSYGYWDFGTDLAMVSGRHHIASIGYSPMQEYYCHRPVDKCRIDFMERALVGNIAIFQELTKLSGDDFKI